MFIPVLVILKFCTYEYNIKFIQQLTGTLQVTEVQTVTYSHLDKNQQSVVNV